MSLARGFLLFLAGLAIGVALAATGPRVAGPYLPEILQDPGEVVEGEVTRKLRLHAQGSRDRSPRGRG
jgi:hypothetical protein